MIPAKQATNEKAATDGKSPRRCEFCLRSEADGTRLISQTTIDGVEEFMCINQFACAIAESNLREHHGL